MKETNRLTFSLNLLSTPPNPIKPPRTRGQLIPQGKGSCKGQGFISSLVQILCLELTVFSLGLHLNTEYLFHITHKLKPYLRAKYMYYVLTKSTLKGPSATDCFTSIWDKAGYTKRFKTSLIRKDKTNTESKKNCQKFFKEYIKQYINWKLFSQTLSIWWLL